MRFLIPLAMLLLLGACGGGEPREAPPDDNAPDDNAGAESPRHAASVDPGRPVAPGPDGVPERCPFRVGDLCYDTSEAACRAAGCEPASCQILESYPAQIRCI